MPDVTINIDAILTAEQKQELAKQVWEENQETIKNGIRKALHHELQSDIVHLARKMLHEELSGMVKAVLKEKLPEIEKTINEVVTYLTGFEDVASGALIETTKDYLEDFTRTSGNRMAEALRRGINRLLEQGQQRYFEMRARRKAGG